MAGDKQNVPPELVWISRHESNDLAADPEAMELGVRVSAWVHDEDGARGPLLWSNRGEAECNCGAPLGGCTCARWSELLFFRPGEADVPAAFSIVARRGLCEVGRRAWVTAVSPQHSYGPGGFPGWGVPAHAAITFDIEVVEKRPAPTTLCPSLALLSWESVPDGSPTTDFLLLEEPLSIASSFPPEVAARYLCTAEEASRKWTCS